MRTLLLTRTSYRKDRTLGSLAVVDGKKKLLEVASLELPWLNNAQKVSCVPAGTYDIKLEWSPAFNMDLWELKGVPNRSEVKLHAANFPKQLLGCIAPALYLMDIDKDGNLDAGSSRKALARIHTELHGMSATTITIIGDGRDTI